MVSKDKTNILEEVMTPTLLTKPTVAVKPAIVAKPASVYNGTILERGISTGIITRMPAAADEVKLVVLNAMGEVASEFSRPATDLGLIGLNFSNALIQKAGKEVYFLMVKGYVKGTLVWEQRLGRFYFHS